MKVFDYEVEAASARRAGAAEFGATIVSAFIVGGKEKEEGDVLSAIL